MIGRELSNPPPKMYWDTIQLTHRMYKFHFNLELGTDWSTDLKWKPISRNRLAEERQPVIGQNGSDNDTKVEL